MRRKSERAATAAKKSKASDVKAEPVTAKRTRSRRSKKQSTSSDDESTKEDSPVREVQAQAPQHPKTPVKEVSPEETPDQVWQVKTAKGTGDTGEIQKLKICLTRPPSTPERVDRSRSPRSKRKHSHATSSSDTPSLDGVEEKKKTRHRKKSSRESKDESERSQDSQSEENKETTEIVEQPNSTYSAETISNTTDTSKPDEGNKEPNEAETVLESQRNESAVADTTVASPKADSTNNLACESVVLDDQTAVKHNDVVENCTRNEPPEPMDLDTSNEFFAKEEQIPQGSYASAKATEEVEPSKEQVSEVEESVVPSEGVHSPNDIGKTNNDHDVLEIECPQFETEKDQIKELEEYAVPVVKGRTRTLGRSISTASTQEESTTNGPPIVINRKRKWGSKSTTVKQKSLTISTDILKDIIPDVKPADIIEVIEEKKQTRRVDVRERIEIRDKYEKPVLPKIIIDNTENVEKGREFQKENLVVHEPMMAHRKISIVREDNVIERPPSPPRNKQSCILYITNLVRPFTIPQLKNLLQRTGKIMPDGFWINKIKSKCYVKYETEDQAVETRHALHGVTWPVSNPKTLQVDFSTDEAFDEAVANEDAEATQTSTIPGTVEDWIKQQDEKREKGELQDKPWEKKTREWDMGKGDKPAEDKFPRDGRVDRLGDKRRHRTPERSPEPAKKFKKKEEEAPAKMLDDLFKKTKATPCIYWLPLSAETIAIKEEQRRKHMAEHERRLNEMRRSRRN